MTSKIVIIKPATKKELFIVDKWCTLHPIKKREADAEADAIIGRRRARAKNKKEYFRKVAKEEKRIKTRREQKKRNKKHKIIRQHRCGKKIREKERTLRELL